MERTALIRAIEAVIFVSSEPVETKRLLEVFEPEEVSASELMDALDSLRRDFVGRGTELCEVSGGWQFRTSPDVADYVARLDMPRPSRLSQASLETIAIIAYRQPVTRTDIEEVRGVDSGAVVRTLMEKGLVRVVGKKDVPGRPMLLGTTRKFLEVFGLSSLTDLPTLREIEELTQAAEDGASPSSQPSLSFGGAEPRPREIPELPMDENDS
ncbi:SMC-Scp complex subunit ScpB [bacterium]|nr:MAG: SMC-Scp complex subunit ScpB [bacterium]